MVVRVSYSHIKGIVDKHLSNLQSIELKHWLDGKPLMMTHIFSNVEYGSYTGGGLAQLGDELYGGNKRQGHPSDATVETQFSHTVQLVRHHPHTMLHHLLPVVETQLQKPETSSSHSSVNQSLYHGHMNAKQKNR